MKVSVVTPSFNQGRFIARTLDSVASQQGVEVEHVVMDGGSADETVEVLRRYPAVRWVSERDRGQAHAVNKGIAATDGDIIGWLNSDDVYGPGALAKAAGYLEAHPEVGVVYGMADHIDLEDRAFEPYPAEPWDLERLKETCFICQPAAFFRRRVVEEHGPLDDTLHYCMDYEYWLRLGKAGVRFAFLPEKLAGSRLYAENKTLGARIKVHAEINDVMKRHFGTVPDRWIFNYAHAVVEARTSRERQPRWFTARLVASSVAAAWRWNRGLSADMRRSLAGWGRAALRRS